MSFLQLVFSLDKTFEEKVLFWRICHLDIFTDACLTNFTTANSPIPLYFAGLPPSCFPYYYIITQSIHNLFIFQGKFIDFP